MPYMIIRTHAATLRSCGWRSPAARRCTWRSGSARPQHCCPRVGPPRLDRPGVEPRRQRRMSEIVRPSSERRSDRGRRERQRPSFLPDAVVRRGPDHSPALVSEQPPVISRAERIEMLPKNGDELGRDRHEPDRFRRPVLETSVIVGFAGIRPLLADTGTRPVQQGRPPASLRQLHVRTGEADGLSRTQSAVVHAGKEADEPTATRTAVPTDVRDRGQQGASLLRIGDHPGIDLPGDLRPRGTCGPVPPSGSALVRTPFLAWVPRREAGITPAGGACAGPLCTVRQSSAGGAAWICWEV